MYRYLFTTVLYTCLTLYWLYCFYVAYKMCLFDDFEFWRDENPNLVFTESLLPYHDDHIHHAFYVYLTHRPESLTVLQLDRCYSEMFNDAGWFVGQGVVNGLPVVPLPSVANANTSTLDVPSTSQGARAPLARRSTLPPGFERPDVQRQRSTTTTEVWSDSPHDNVVSNLKGQLRLMEAFDKPDTPARSEGLAADVVEGKKPLKVRKPENLYDPFSGQTIGLFSPGPGELDDTQEELWNHLARIHELQSQISVMHSHMEHLGTGERPARMERSVDDEAENPEESARVAKEAEFAKLADRFTGRKEQIDNVMLKVRLTIRLMKYQLLTLCCCSWGSFRKPSIIFMRVVLLCST